MQIFLVGGAVRDKLLKIDVYDQDWVVVGASPQLLLEQGFVAVGKDFPVFLHPKTKQEHALARTERKTGSGYKGFDCYFAPDVTLEEDLIRRDLTINAMAEDKQGRIIDPYGGQNILMIAFFATFQVLLQKILFAYSESHVSRRNYITLVLLSPQKLNS